MFPSYVRSLDFQIFMQLFIFFIFSSQIESISTLYPCNTPRALIGFFFTEATTCINTNGFTSRYVSITRSSRQGCPIAPMLYILQAEPLAAYIRQNPCIKGIETICVNAGFCLFEQHLNPFPKNSTKAKFVQTKIYPFPLGPIECFLSKRVR
jgi:hypothetical protein